MEFSGTGMLARCLQHETDHTRGTVFGDRLPTKQRKKLQKAMEKAADDYPPDWPASDGGRDSSVRIVHLSPEALAALAARDLDGATRADRAGPHGVLVSDERVGIWQRRAVQVIETPEDLPWVTGVLVDDETGAVVGAAGFHAAPDADGMVEAGYGVDPAYRRRGYARAALLLMIDRARSEPSVHVFRVTVSPDNAASSGWSRSCPFVEVGEQWDDEDGLEIDLRAPRRLISHPSRARTPATRSAPGGDVAGHGCGGGDVERVDAAGHRDGRATVRGLLPARRETVPLRAQHQRQPVHAGDGLLDGDGVVGQGERDRGEAALGEAGQRVVPVRQPRPRQSRTPRPSRP